MSVKLQSHPLSALTSLMYSLEYKNSTPFHFIPILPKPPLGAAHPCRTVTLVSFNVQVAVTARETYYLVPNSWVKRWRTYVAEGSKAKAASAAAQPPPPPGPLPEALCSILCRWVAIPCSLNLFRILSSPEWSLFCKKSKKQRCHSSYLHLVWSISKIYRRFSSSEST